MDLAPDLTEFGWCPFARVVGEPCILCGGTRAGLSLFSGDVTEALRYNAVVVVLLVSGMARGGYLLARGLPVFGGLDAWVPYVGRTRVLSLGILVTFFVLWWAWNMARW